MEYVRPVDFAAFKPTEFHSQVIASDQDGVEGCTLICTRVPPGKGTTAGLHVHPADQFYYVLSGEMTVQIGAKQYVARPDSLVFIPAGVPHWNWNATQQDEVHFEMIVPAAPPGHPRSFAVQAPQLTAAPADDSFYVRPTDMSKFAPDQFMAIPLANRNSGSTHCRINLARVPAGKSGPSLHIHPVDQIYYVLSGTMNLQVGRQYKVAGPNTYVIFPAGVPHCNWNEGTEPETHLVVFAPEPAPGVPASQPVTIDV